MTWDEMIIFVGGLAASLIAIYNLYQKFYGSRIDKLKETIATIDERLDVIERKLESDYNSMLDQAQINSITLKSISALIKQTMGSDNLENMEKCINEIDQYLMDKAGRI